MEVIKHLQRLERMLEQAKEIEILIDKGDFNDLVWNMSSLTMNLRWAVADYEDYLEAHGL